jgi:hypothetical protein
MKDETTTRGMIMSPGIYIAAAISVLLVMLCQLWSAEKYLAGSSSWLLKFDVAAPMLFGMLFAGALWKSVQRGKMTRRLAANVLLMLGVLLVFTYQAFDRLAIRWR